MQTQEIVQRLGNLCHVLRDDGITYHEYVTELTYLLFLKMAEEQGGKLSPRIYSGIFRLGQSCSSMIWWTHAGRSPSLLGFCSVTAVDRFGPSRSPKLEAEMTQPLSPNTQAILLLTAPLFVGRKGGSEQPLTASEYTRLAVYLRDAGRSPADLLTVGSEALVQDCSPLVNTERMKQLLARGFLLSQAVERWASRAIWVVSRADAAYPRRLKTRLGTAAPAVLYGCGDVRLLEGRATSATR